MTGADINIDILLEKTKKRRKAGLEKVMFIITPYIDIYGIVRQTKNNPFSRFNSSLS